MHHWTVHRDATTGSVTWTRPDGTPYDPTVTLAGGDVNTLALHHLDHGHHIDAQTIETYWDGRPLTDHITDNCLNVLAQAASPG